LTIVVIIIYILALARSVSCQWKRGQTQLRTEGLSKLNLILLFVMMSTQTFL